MLIYAGIGLCVEHMWLSRTKMSKKDFLCVWTIVIVNAIFDLIIAVVSGIVLAALIFAYQYGRGGVIKAVLRGTEYQSRVVRSEKDEAKQVDERGALSVAHKSNCRERSTLSRTQVQLP